MLFPYREPVWPKHRFTVRMNHKLTIEEDVMEGVPPTWRTPFDPKKIAHQGSNHKMKDLQGCQQRG
jgi:hypothetical protein